ncbi:MAG: HK97 gp10 family phage protein [Prevotella sp.]|nr:HK97 gp10 family phage protein [Prevotella sp.]
MNEIKINVETLVENLSEEIKAYTAEVVEDVSDAVNRCTSNLEKEIRRNSPEGKTGEFKDGWDRFTYQRRDRSARAGVVKNKVRGSLVHLLEFGHKARNFEKNHIMVAPSPPHGNVKPANEKAMKELDEEIKHILSFTK